MGVVWVEGFVNIQPGEEGVGVVRVEGFVNIQPVFVVGLCLFTCNRSIMCKERTRDAPPECLFRPPKQYITDVVISASFPFCRYHS